MSDRGYQDSSKVSDAKALQLLFKSKTGAKSQSNIPKKRAGPSMQAARPAPARPSHVPPSGSTTPSTTDRFYTPTLLPNPLDRKAGAILGSSASDFLGRRDVTPKLSSNLVQGQDHKGKSEVPSTPSTVPKAQEVSPSPAQKESEKPVVKLPSTLAAIPEATKQDCNSIQEAEAHATSINPPTVSKTPERVNNLDLPCGFATDSGQTSIKASTAGTAAGHPKTPAQTINPSGKELKKKTLLELFQNQKSDDESDCGISDCQAKKAATHDSKTAEPLKYSPDKLLELKANAKTGVIPPDCIAKRHYNSQKAGIATTYKSAASFIAHSNTSGSGSQVGMTESTVPRPAAPQTSPQQAKIDSNQAPTVTTAQPAQVECLINFEEGQVELKPGAADKVPGTDSLHHQRWMSGHTYDDLVDLQTSSEHTKIDSIQAPTEAKSEYVQAEDPVACKEFRGPEEPHGLRPQAPGFVSRLHAPPAISMPDQFATPSPIDLGGSEASQHALTKTLVPADQFMVTAIPVATHANGFRITGPPTSQIMPRSPINDTFSTELPLRTAGDNEEVARAPRKPTKGLGASMWAK
ncbi:uncharacterized protein FFB20_09556 [Fusarium fujikuroi]|nr:uncharacterized protein Y057_12356 [Fusarium fujikuroi]SCN93869.1 uncharacterized protein FFB20_09556 [Fusarium fujikuroi]SCN95116.1 uncharacterized protein FFE2_08135 [Fusarium fujikuroi]SCO21737.1 uncharacterized protein FFC1_14263 [Fusarium fujikuroi]SCO46273.1 uncharacterized protein FFNC_10778 [Fusarium fujikuroi]